MTPDYSETLLKIMHALTNAPAIALNVLYRNTSNSDERLFIALCAHSIGIELYEKKESDCD